MLLLAVRGPRAQVVTIGLGVVGIAVELTVGVETLGAVRCLLGARPLDPRRAAQAPIAERAVVARAPARAGLPGLEGRLRVAPLHQRLPVCVPEVHPAGVVEEDL